MRFSEIDAQSNLRQTRDVHQSFEQSLHVGEKEWLMLIDDDPGRGVTGLDADEAVPNSRAHYEFRNALGQVDELEWLVGL